MMLQLQRALLSIKGHGAMFQTVYTQACSDDLEDAEYEALCLLGQIYAGVSPVAWPGPYRVYVIDDEGHELIVTHHDERLCAVVGEAIENETERLKTQAWHFRHT